MSVKEISHQKEMTCDGCGFSEIWESVGDAKQKLAMIMKASKWYQLVRHAYDPDQGQIVQLSVHACSRDCLASASAKLEVPPPAPAAIDGIDLDELRQQR